MEKLPSIWKNVAWRVVLPTSSMSGVRTHFCAVASRTAGGLRCPRKYGLNGTIPALTRSSVGSSAIRLAEGTILCPRSSKKRRKRRAISADSIVAILCVDVDVRPVFSGPGVVRVVEPEAGAQLGFALSGLAERVRGKVSHPLDHARGGAGRTA